MFAVGADAGDGHQLGEIAHQFRVVGLEPIKYLPHGRTSLEKNGSRESLRNEQEMDEWFHQNIRSLLVLDDLMQETDGTSGKIISMLFTRGSHHRNLSIILVTQNLFQQNRYFRTISLNSSYIVVFKNPRDGNQIDHLARQIFPSKKYLISEAYRRATERPHGYLLLDMKQTTPDNMRIRTNIFDEMKNQINWRVI